MRITIKQASYAVLLGIIILGVIYSLYNFSKQNQQVPQVKNYKIGVLIDNTLFQSNLNGFKSKMEELGYKENANTQYVVKNPNSDAKLREQYVNEIIDSKPDLIVSASNIATRQFKTLTSIPVVFLDIGSTEGIVQNPSAPEGNITGITGGNVEFNGKRLEVLKELVPGIKKVIISPDKNFPNYAPFMKILSAAAAELNLQIVEIPSANSKDFVARAGSIINKKNGDAFIFFSGPNNAVNTPEDQKIIINQLIKEKMPSITHNMELGANIGLLIAYGVYRQDVGKEAAVLADSILRGIPIKELPVFSPIKSLVLEINSATAETIGIVIPQNLLARANKIYNE
ncbi:MAG: ABC transporter substrate-binding protein [bacterium]|nr:ABC transporter substrate-binding protein [bacterium]